LTASAKERVRQILKLAIEELVQEHPGLPALLKSVTIKGYPGAVPSIVLEVSEDGKRFTLIVDSEAPWIKDFFPAGTEEGKKAMIAALQLALESFQTQTPSPTDGAWSVANYIESHILQPQEKISDEAELPWKSFRRRLIPVISGLQNQNISNDVIIKVLDDAIEKIRSGEKSVADEIFQTILKDALILSDGHEMVSRGVHFEPTLEGTFGTHAIKRVHDSATGNGLWMRMVKDKPWVDPNARITGSDLQEHAHAAQYEANYDGLEVFYDPAKIPGSVDVLHEAYMSEDAFDDATRLDSYNKLLNPGGFLMIAHSVGYDNGFAITFKWLEAHGYRYHVYAQEMMPKDYPVTLWGTQFSQSYLIVAKKPVSADANSVGSQNLVDAKARSHTPSSSIAGIIKATGLRVSLMIVAATALTGFLIKIKTGVPLIEPEVPALAWTIMTMVILSLLFKIAKPLFMAWQNQKTQKRDQRVRAMKELPAGAKIYDEVRVGAKDDGQDLNDLLTPTTDRVLIANRRRSFYEAVRRAA
jgi:hypothetical protein